MCQEVEERGGGEREVEEEMEEEKEEEMGVEQSRAEQTKAEQGREDQSTFISRRRRIKQRRRSASCAAWAEHPPARAQPAARDP